MAQLAGVARYVLAVMAAAGLYMSNVGPQDAASNLSKWFGKFAPEWMKAPSIDELSTIVFAVILAGAILPVLIPAIFRAKQASPESIRPTVNRWPWRKPPIK